MTGGVRPFVAFRYASQGDGGGGASFPKVYKLSFPKSFIGDPDQFFFILVSNY